MKKIICSILALLMAISPLSTFALTTDASPPGTTPVKLTIAPLTFKATVPTGLPFDLDAAGVTTPASEASIINGTMGPIKVVSVTTTSEGTWTLTNYTDDFTSKKVNSKDLALRLNTDNVQTDGGITLTPQNWPTIEGNGNLRLDYQGKFAPQEKAITDTVAHVSFVLDWDDAVITPEKPTIQYVLATDEDFSEDADGSFQYTGTDKYVEVPHEIKGIPVTSYNNMFANTSVEGVKSTNKNVTDMSYMFYNSKATKLNLSELDTSNVTNMKVMFMASLALELDLSNFNTSKVTDMYGMFEGSQATVLDLSRFDTSKVIDMDIMFAKSKATTLDLSSFDTSKVTNMSTMFEASKATTLNLSNFDTSNVTDMSAMFYDSEATTLDLSSFDTSSVTDMSDMFMASKATTLDLSSFDTSNVTTMRSMFESSQAIELDLGSFDTSNVTDMRDMFNGNQATTGYAKTQVDADKLNLSKNKPATLTFTVK